MTNSLTSWLSDKELEGAFVCDRCHQQEFRAVDSLCSSRLYGSVGIVLYQPRLERVDGDNIDAAGRRNSGRISVSNVGFDSGGINSQHYSLVADRPDTSRYRHQAAHLGRFQTTGKAGCVRRLDRESLPVLSILQQYAGFDVMPGSYLPSVGNQHTRNSQMV